MPGEFLANSPLFMGKIALNEPKKQRSHNNPLISVEFYVVRRSLNSGAFSQLSTHVRAREPQARNDRCPADDVARQLLAVATQLPFNVSTTCASKSYRHCYKAKGTILRERRVRGSIANHSGA
jgi:hypothetical protein